MEGDLGLSQWMFLLDLDLCFPNYGTCSGTPAPELPGPPAPNWCCGLRHCISVLEASPQTLVRFQAESQPAGIGSPIGRPSVIQVRVWPG